MYNVCMKQCHIAHIILYIYNFTHISKKEKIYISIYLLDFTKAIWTVIGEALGIRFGEPWLPKSLPNLHEKIYNRLYQSYWTDLVKVEDIPSPI